MNLYGPIFIHGVIVFLTNVFVVVCLGQKYPSFERVNPSAAGG